MSIFGSLRVFVVGIINEYLFHILDKNRKHPLVVRDQAAEYALDRDHSHRKAALLSMGLFLEGGAVRPPIELIFADQKLFMGSGY